MELERFAEALLSTQGRLPGGEGRIRAARFPARKTLEEFDFSSQRSVQKQLVLYFDQLDFLAARENVILRPARRTGKTIWRSRSRSAPASPAIASCSAPSPMVPLLSDPDAMACSKTS